MANIKHQQQYDYSKVKYVRSNIPVIIICPYHGEFKQSPAHHLSGQKCPVCSGKVVHNTKSFIDASVSVHGDKYDYSSANYINAKTKITIICPNHGKFDQIPFSHYGNKSGCPRCVGKNKTTKDFIHKAVQIHGYKYDYSDTVYTGVFNKTIIICPQHGKFRQTPDAHLAGKGCSECVGRISKKSQHWLNSMGIPDDDLHREVHGLVDNHRYCVDGYDPITKTIYEFHGDYWHGNPMFYDPNDINPTSKNTYGELYEKTLMKKKEFIDAGYNYVEMWESDWDAQ